MQSGPHHRIILLAISVMGVLAGFSISGCQAQQPGTQGVAETGTRVDTREPPLPRGVVIYRGTALGTADTASFALAETKHRGKEVLWLARESGSGKKEATYDVLDELLLPRLAPDRRIMLAICGTLHPGAATTPEPEEVVLDPEIVAIARSAGAAVLTGIEQAWRANPATGKFEPIPTAEMACLNDVESEF